MADRELTLDDLTAVEQASPALTQESAPFSQADRAAAEKEYLAAHPEEAPKAINGEGFVRSVVNSDFMPVAAARSMAAAGMPYDPNFEIGKDLTEKEYDELTHGLSDEARQNIAEMAHSRPHLQFLVELARESDQREAFLASYGGWGIAGRLATDIADPGTLLLSMGTGGIGVGSKAQRLAKAAQAITSTAERKALVEGIKEGLSVRSAAGILQPSLLAGAENMGIQSIINAGDPNKDGWDLAQAGLTGVALSGLVSGALSRGQKRQLNQLYRLHADRLANEEMIAEVAKIKDTLTKGIGDVDAARARLAELHADLGSFVASREGDVSSYPAFRRALESNGIADATNPNSSAVGIDQFTQGTWKGIVSKEKPKWAEGLSEEALLELRKDPAKSGEMAAALDAQNADILRKKGLPVNQYTLYATHHFGPSKGAKFAEAAGETLMDDILSKTQLDANPNLKGLTKDQVLAGWTDKARRNGAKLDEMVDHVPADEAASLAEHENFDAADAEKQLADVEDALKQHSDSVAKASAEAAAEVPSGQLRKLRREAADIESELNGRKGTKLAELTARLDEVKAKIAAVDEARGRRVAHMTAEDEAKLGKDIAGNKFRTKKRAEVADRLAARERKALNDPLMWAKDAHARHSYKLRTRLAELQPHIAKGDAAVAAKATLKALMEDTRPAQLTAKGDQLRAALKIHTDRGATLAGLKSKRAMIKDALKATKGDHEALNKLDAADKVTAGANLRATHLEAAGSAPSFGVDTLSAARVIGLDPGIHPQLEGSVGSPDIGKMKLAGALHLWGKGTFAGVLRGSDNEVVRNELGVLVGNSLGTVGDKVTVVGASEIASHVNRKYMGQFHAAVTPAYEKWLTEKGIWKGKRWNRDIRDAFMRELGLHVRGQESESAAVRAISGRISGIFKDFLMEAKEAGVKGFENVQPNENWLPRVFDFHAFHALNQRFGSDQLALLLQKAIQQTNTGLDNETANKVGRAYIKRMRELRVGSNAGLMQGLSFDDVTFLRDFLGEAGMHHDEIEEVVGKFAAAKLSGGEAVLNQEGSFRHAKMRQKFDENFSMELRDVEANDGSTLPMTVSDLFENNVEKLFGRYARTMSGHIALGKVGIKSRADFELRIKRVERALEHDAAHLADVKQKAQAAYDLITARPLEDSNVWSELMRTSRDVAYATQMENAGIANIPDMAALISWGNFKYLSKEFFSGRVFGALWKRGKDGRMLDEAFRELEEVFGVGTDYLNNAIHSSYDVADEYSRELVQGKLVPRMLSKGFSSVSHGARVVGRAVTAGSGMAAISASSQRLAARILVYRLKDHLFNGPKFSKARLAAMGLDEPMLARIKSQMQKHTSWVKSEGGKFQRVEFVKWDDLDARDAFLYAVHREARKNIQEEDLGDTFMFQHRGMGKVLSQFRRFAITAYTKQTLRGIADHDAEAATRALFQFMLAAGAWEARHQMVMAGMKLAGVDQSKIDEYHDKNLAPDRIVAAGVRNSGVAALAPDVYDTFAGTMFGTPFFDVRNTGNSTNLVAGVPSVGLANNIGTAAAAVWQSMLRGDRQFDKHDLRAVQSLVPFGDHFLVAPAFQALSQHLPDHDEDTDKDHAQWFWE